MPVLTIADIRRNREAREQRAIERAATLNPARDYFASDSAVVDRNTRSPVVQCESHWDACLVLLALPGGTLHDAAAAKASARANNDLARMNAGTIDRLRGELLTLRGEPSSHT